MRIGFPVKCRYRGGNRSLGPHGRQLWIKDGRIGYGQFLLSRGIPIESVQRVAVSERSIEGVERQIVLAQGLRPSGRRTPKSRTKIFSDISVSTSDGQSALWVVERRSAEWVRRKLGPVLSERQIPLD